MADDGRQPEFRVDPLSGLRVIVATGRSGRPGSEYNLDEPAAIDSESDPFAEGSEQKTPPEVWADRPGGGGDRRREVVGELL